MSRTILITGANRGIGLGLTRYFLAGKHRVVATARNLDTSKHLVELKERYPQTCFLETLDVKSDLSVKGLAEKVADLGHPVIPSEPYERRGSACLDILVNNAGILHDDDKDINVDLNHVLNTFAVNALASMRVTREFLPQLHKNKNAVVANITSRMGSIGDNTSGGYYAYRMSKAALNAFNKSLSIDFPKLICLTLHPGWVQTDMGGKNATLTLDESCPALGKIIEHATPAHTGKFFDYSGKEIPW